MHAFLGKIALGVAERRVVEQPGWDLRTVAHSYGLARSKPIPMPQRPTKGSESSGLSSRGSGKSSPYLWCEPTPSDSIAFLQEEITRTQWGAMVVLGHPKTANGKPTLRPLTPPFNLHEPQDLCRSSCEVLQMSDPHSSHSPRIHVIRQKRTAQGSEPFGVVDPFQFI